MEACGGAQHWARSLMKMGHQVRLMPARFVKAFNIGNKNDAADARAIWLAVQQPCKAVAVKTERSEEHTSELQSLMRISYAVFCLQKKTKLTRTAKSSVSNN